MSEPPAVILITGGLGFIGLELAKTLVTGGYRVVLFDNLSPQIHGAIPQVQNPLFDRPNIHVVRGSINDHDTLEPLLQKVSAVVHLAAETGTGQSMYQIAHYNQINTQGTAVLLDILANKPHSVKKVVLASSRSIYGEGAYKNLQTGSLEFPPARSQEALFAHQWEPVGTTGQPLQAVATPEDTPPRPASIYAATKYAQEDLVRIACGSLGIGYTVLRFQNVYGNGQSLNNPYTGILSIFSTRIRKGLMLPIFEDGKETRDFVHVRDVVSAIRLSLESDRANGQTFNVGSGIPTSVFDVARLLVRALKGTSEIRTTGQYRLGDIRHCYADLTRIRERLGFQPEVSLEQGIDEFAGWVLTQTLPEDRLEQANRELIERKLMG
ncbi:MAG: GDP-mannose 4,6-dehydratase [Meiothermus sp.]|nr:GDP-mannose 4,6-dehydratase [Meiothermus sp.]